MRTAGNGYHAQFYTLDYQAIKPIFCLKNQGIQIGTYLTTKLSGYVPNLEHWRTTSVISGQ